MKSCPNPGCPAVRRASHPSVYRDEIDRCAECGTDLIPFSPDDRLAPASGVPGRLLVSAIVAAALHEFQFVPLPLSGDIDPVLEPFDGNVIEPLLFHNSYNVVLICFVLVEIVAWAVPGWRHLGRAGSPGRATLNRVSIRLAVAFAMVQAFGLGMYHKSTGGLSASTVTLWAVSAGAAVCAVVVMVHCVERFGLGRGWSIVALVVVVDDLRYGSFFSMHPSPVPVQLILVSMAFLTLVTVSVLVAADSRRSNWLPLPTTGIVPLLWPSLLVADWIVVVASRVNGVAGGEAPTTLDLILRLMVVTAVGLLCHRVYSGGVAKMYPSGVGVRSLLASLALLGLATTIEHLLATRGVWVFAPSVLLVIAIAWDLVQETRFRLVHGAVRDVRSAVHASEARQLTTVLAAHSIPAIALGQAHRSMLRFFGPYVTVNVVVPIGYEAAARACLATASGQDEARGP